MQPADGSGSRPDIGYAPDSLKRTEPFALFRIPGNENDLVDNLPERIDQPFNKRPAVIGEKILFPTMCTSCIPADQYYCRSHGNVPFMDMILLFPAAVGSLMRKA
jgi:hypothetical protein